MFLCLKSVLEGKKKKSTLTNKYIRKEGLCATQMLFYRNVSGE